MGSKVAPFGFAEEEADVEVAAPATTSTSSSTLKKTKDEDDDEEKGEPSLLRDFMSFALFAFVLVPLVVVPFSLLFGGILAAIEGWSFLDGFYSVISNVLGLPNPLVDSTPNDDFGRLVDIVVSLWSIGITGTVIAMVGGMTLVTRLVESVHPAFVGMLAAVRGRVGVSETRSWVVEFTVFGVVVIFIVPGVVLLLSCLFAAMLSGVEGWSFHDAFMYVTSGICGLSNPLTDVSPDTHGGKVFDIIISIWSLSLSGAVIGAVGAFALVDAVIKTAEGRKVDLAEDAADLQAAMASGDRLTFQTFLEAINRGESQWPEPIARSVFEALDVDSSGDLDRTEGDRLVSILNALGKLGLAPQESAKALNDDS